MATDEEIAAANDDALIQALRLGKTVTIGDRSWSSHDLEDLLKIRAIQNIATGAAGPRFAAFSKGVD